MSTARIAAIIKETPSKVSIDLHPEPNFWTRLTGTGSEKFKFSAYVSIGSLSTAAVGALLLYAKSNLGAPLLAIGVIGTFLAEDAFMQAARDSKHFASIKESAKEAYPEKEVIIEEKPNYFTRLGL